MKCQDLFFMEKVKMSSAAVFMPLTSEKLEGHIASGTFVRLCVRTFRFLMHRITSEPRMLGF